ncbi:MAG: DUF1285 domain-containing protein [Rhodospirillales bacterium]|jgi:hypothetical protein
MNKQKLDALNSLSSLPNLAGNNESNSPGDSPEGQTLCGDFDIRIDRDGLWFYHGSPIGRKELVKLFSSVLNRDKDGKYWLITPAEKGEIVVEDVPFQAVELTVEGELKHQNLTFRTNIDEIVMADEAHPIRIETDSQTGEPSPYIMVRDGLEARLTRAVFYQMVDLGVEIAAEIAQGDTNYHDKSFGVWSGGQFFQIGTLTDQD